MSNSIKIVTLAKKSKKDPSVCTIYLRVKLFWGNQVDEILFSTREDIKFSQYRGSIEPVKGSTNEAQRINARVRMCIEKVYSLHDEYVRNNTVLKRKGFKAIIDSIVFGLKTDDTIEKKPNLPELFDRYLKQHKNDLCDNRKKRYQFVKSRIKEFCLEEYGVEDYELNNLNHEFYNSFKNYLFNCYDYENNTVIGYLRILKATAREAFKSSIINYYPFEDCKDKFSENDIKYLTEDQLNKIKNYEFEDESLQHVADCFVFAAHTGLSFTDLYTLKSSHISNEMNRLIIKKKRQKTGVLSIVPLDETALGIIRKYQDDPICISKNRLLPVKFINEYNEKLKLIQLMCNIDLKLTSHVARHTMATTNWLSKGGTFDVLQKILGHKSLRTTQIYGKVKLDRILEEADKIHANKAV